MIAYASGRLFVATISRSPQVSTVKVYIDGFDAGAANRLLAEMADAARAIVAAGTKEPIEIRRSCEMRYIGQGHEIVIPLPDGNLSATDVKDLRESYEARYEEQFHMRVHGVPVEFLTWNVVATGASPAWQEPEVPKPTGTVAKKREVFDLDAGTYVLSTELGLRGRRALE